VFDAEQPDGSQSTVDLSAPGDRGDFAFLATGPGRGRGNYFFAYHSYEASVFLDVLGAMCTGRDAADVLLDVERIHDQLGALTCGMTATETAENSFDFPLRSLADAAWPDVRTVGGAYRGDGYGSATRAVSARAHGLTFDMRAGDRAPASVTIPTRDLWQFAAGMMWRSYGDRRNYSLLSRLSSLEYHNALDTCLQRLHR
jgi:hypothetical protein